jgi:hypothetical protein
LQESQPVGIDEQPLPTLHANIGHSDASMHEKLPVHETSHEQDVAHFVLRLHELVPLHVTSQSPGEHWISS